MIASCFKPRDETLVDSDHLSNMAASSLGSNTEQEQIKSAKIRKGYIVEPVAFLYFLGYMIFLPTIQQYVYHILMQQHGIDDQNIDKITQCTNKNSTNSSLASKISIVQKESSEFMLIQNTVVLLPSFTMTLFLGRYTDHAGRRIALILPIVGGFLKATICLSIVCFRLNLYLITLANLADCLTGGPMSLIMAINAYICDVTSPERRSFRMIMLELFMLLGVALSNTAAGFIIKLLGFDYSFLFGMFFHSLNLIFTLFFLKESVENITTVPFFALSHIKESVQIFSKDNGTGRRWKLLVVLGLFIACMTAEIGLLDIVTFFLLDVPLCFSSVEIGLYSTLSYIGKGFGSVILLKTLHRTLGDSGLVIVGCVSGFLAQLFLAFSVNRVMIYCVSIVALGTGLTGPLCRSISSQLVEATERGSMFSVIAFCQQLSLLLGGLLFNSLYAKTVTFYAALSFFASAAVYGLGLALAVALHVGIRRQQVTVKQMEPLAIN